MKPSFALAVLALALCPLSRAVADDAKPPVPSAFKYVAWSQNLAEAFDTAKATGKPVFIAINADLIQGKPERANTELREHTYLAAAVVAKSKEFVCALVKSDGDSVDFGELRSHFGIEGKGIVAPQHIFAFPDGTLLSRKEYWPYGEGQGSVDALVTMMDEALRTAQARKGMPSTPPPPGGTTTPGDGAKPTDPNAPGADPAAGPGAAPGAAPGAPGSVGEQRADWIRGKIELVRTGGKEARDLAIKDLIAGDQKGDCVAPLCSVMLETKKDADLQIAILKALGKPGLEIARPAVETMLDDKFDGTRANAACTLEYIGSAKSVEALTKRVPKERDEATHGNLCRALGRCGAKQEEVRKTLLHEAQSAKKPDAVIGPIVGLAYFEKDADTARALEKMAKKDAGDPLKRTIELWAIAEILDPKSAVWMKKEYLADEKEPKGWIEQIVYSYNHAVLAKLEGSADQQGGIDGGVDGTLGWRGIHPDSSRRGREQGEFKPKFEFEGKMPGGMGGGRGGPPPPGMGG